MIDFWQNIYTNIDPIAFQIGPIAVHWYGVMYALAFIVAIIFAHWLIKHDQIPISKDLFNEYVFWAEIGVILGARLGYVLFYDSHTYYYLTHPWQIFNPFIDGVYAGISGMSYHGAVFGFIIATFLFCKKYKVSFWFIGDIAAIGIAIGYIFGRIGNFLNHELFGRETTMPWGIWVGNTLRHPSQLYEAFFEGFVVFVLLFFYRKKKTFDGELLILYAMLYSCMRILCEFFREPDIQLGFIAGNWLTMGMIISGIFLAISSVIFIYKKSN